MNKTVKTFEGELELGHLDMLVAASARDMWVEELQELAETDERIVFVTADGGYAGKENEFRLKHPDRIFARRYCRDGPGRYCFGTCSLRKNSVH